jgi:hypothetical protein
MNMTGSFFRSSVFKERLISLPPPLEEGKPLSRRQELSYHALQFLSTAFLFFLGFASDPAGQADLAATATNVPQAHPYVNPFYDFIYPATKNSFTTTKHTSPGNPSTPVIKAVTGLIGIRNSIHSAARFNKNNTKAPIAEYNRLYQIQRSGLTMDLLININRITPATASSSHHSIAILLCLLPLVQAYEQRGEGRTIKALSL